MDTKKYQELFTDIMINKKDINKKPLFEFNLGNKEYNYFLSCIRDDIVNNEEEKYDLIKKALSLPQVLKFSITNCTEIYRNNQKGCILYKNSCLNIIYKFTKNVNHKLEGYIHEGIIGLCGINHLPTNNFCKVIDVFKDNTFLP